MCLANRETFDHPFFFVHFPLAFGDLSWVVHIWWDWLGALKKYDGDNGYFLKEVLVVFWEVRFFGVRLASLWFELFGEKGMPGYFRIEGDLLRLLELGLFPYFFMKIWQKCIFWYPSEPVSARLESHYRAKKLGGKT